MIFWYLGSPYAKYPGNRWWHRWSRRARLNSAFKAVCIEAGELIKAKIPIYSPIAHIHSVARFTHMDPLDHAIWLPADKPLMQAAYGLIVLKLPSWQISYGLEREIEFFAEMKRPVIYMTPGKIPEEIRK